MQLPPNTNLRECSGFLLSRETSQCPIVDVQYAQGLKARNVEPTLKIFTGSVRAIVPAANGEYFIDCRYTKVKLVFHTIITRGQSHL